MKTLKTILIISLTILLTLLIKLPEKTNTEVQAAPVIIETEGVNNTDLATATVDTIEYSSEATEDVWYDENDNMLDDLYWQQDFLKDCMAEGDYKVSYHPCGLYSQAMKVVDKGDDYIVFENSNGFQYIVNDKPQDVGLNEIYSCIMYDNTTFDTVKDDILVRYDYDRVDLLID